MTASNTSTIRTQPDYNLQNGSGYTALILAVLGNHYELAMKLVEVTDVNLPDKNGRTPLFYAVLSSSERKSCYGDKTSPYDLQQSVKLVEKLIQYKADCNININGSTPLWIAIQNGVREYIDLLIQHTDLSLTYSMGENILGVVIRRNGNDLDIMDQLIKSGTDCNHISHQGLTPLMIACRLGRFQYLDFLLKHSDVNTRNKRGKTALYYTIKLQEDASTIKTVRKLVEAGTDLNLQYKGFNTILMLACMMGKLQMANEFVKIPVPKDQKQDFAEEVH